MDSRPVIGITMGDPAGIGPELCLRAFREPSVLAQSVPVVFGDRDILERVAWAAGLASGCRVVSLADCQHSDAVKEPMIVDCAAFPAEAVQRGVVAAACGNTAFTYLKHAIHAAVKLSAGWSDFAAAG